jgi:hypothetical protein
MQSKTYVSMHPLDGSMKKKRIFQKEFVKILSHRHNTNRIHANLVYQEYIADRHHIHMSGTKWSSLREFCFHLQRQGIVTVDETERGVFIQWWGFFGKVHENLIKSIKINALPLKKIIF